MAGAEMDSERLRGVRLPQYLLDPVWSMEEVIGAHTTTSKPQETTVAEAKTKTKPTCPSCGSDAVLRDAYAEWDIDSQDWVLQNTFDTHDCGACGDIDFHPEWVDVDDSEVSS